MNFTAVSEVLYHMKKFFPYIKTVICLLACVAVCIFVPCIAFAEDGKNISSKEKSLLRVWEIDSFEGGKGSRADFLQKIGNKYSEISDCYVTVTSVSAEAARLNIGQGNVPDLISYGAGIYGIENYLQGWVRWCFGSYCFLTLDINADFTDINTENTLINAGKDNFSQIAALLTGIGGADTEKSTGAYVKLIGGQYKYLLGTQRDIFRLRTRGENFRVKAVRQFNDLYQNISITTLCANKAEAQGFIDFLLGKQDEVITLGLFCEKKLYEDEMGELEGVEYEYRISTPISADTKSALDNLISDRDINSLKTLLK